MHVLDGAFERSAAVTQKSRVSLGETPPREDGAFVSFPRRNPLFCARKRIIRSAIFETPHLLHLERERNLE